MKHTRPRTHDGSASSGHGVPSINDAVFHSHTSVNDALGQSASCAKGLASSALRAARVQWESVAGCPQTSQATRALPQHTRSNRETRTCACMRVPSRRCWCGTSRAIATASTPPIRRESRHIVRHCRTKRDAAGSATLAKCVGECALPQTRTIIPRTRVSFHKQWVSSMSVMP